MGQAELTRKCLFKALNALIWEEERSKAFHLMNQKRWESLPKISEW